MKVEQAKSDYTPVTITLESQEECDTLRRIMEEVIRITSGPFGTNKLFPRQQEQFASNLICELVDQLKFGD